MLKIFSINLNTLLWYLSSNPNKLQYIHDIHCGLNRSLLINIRSLHKFTLAVFTRSLSNNTLYTTFKKKN